MSEKHYRCVWCNQNRDAKINLDVKVEAEEVENVRCGNCGSDMKFLEEK